MPQDTKLARDQWERYSYCRDHGHLDYVKKSRRCEDFFAGYPGLQWDPLALAKLREQRRPGISINKILSTLSSIFGEQIDLRTEIAYKAKYGAPSGNADVLTKLFRHISDENQLNWVRSELFADGCITSRGFVDVRMEFADSVTGSVAITNMNPRCVIPDPDAWEYDPDKWGDVIVTKWMTPLDIRYLYGEDAYTYLRDRSESNWDSGFDSIDRLRDRFSGTTITNAVNEAEDRDVSRIVRVIDRQHRQAARVKYFVDLKTGDRKAIPESWERDRIAVELATAQAAGASIAVDEVLGTKIKWTVTAEDYVLHDKWSPYKHFTIIPYFPYFRYGRTIGLVENLIDPQELLNKTISQELHVVNTTANSGWKIKKGSLQGMTRDELEERGAQSGIVLELNSVEDAEKIQPNQIPQGLDRLSVKAEQAIKTVSSRGDAQMGMARADASADQIEANKMHSDVGLRKPLDNLARTDWILARNVLDIVQEFYTDPRIARIARDDLSGQDEEIRINWPDATTGEIMNDVSLGEFEVTVVSQPAKQSLEDSQFEQAAYMREKLGVQIPDEFLIENSRLVNKTNLVAAIKEAKNSEAAQLQEQMKVMGGKLQLAEIKAEVSKTEADATLKRAKATKEISEVAGKPEEQAKAEQEMALEAQKHEQEMAMQREKHDQEMQLAREKAEMEMQIKQKLAAEDARRKRAEAIVAARADPNKQAAAKPQPKAA